MFADLFASCGLCALLACTTPPSTPQDDPPPVAEPLFTFAVVADPHVVSAGENADKLTAALDWIDANAEAQQIELVLAVGDLAWGAGLDLVPGLFDAVSVPVVPLVGDNEVHAGDDERFDRVFAPRYQALAAELDGWDRAPTPTWEPELQRDVWLQNAAWTHRGVRFISLDWAVRGVDGVLGELGTLHDADGGTLPWLAAQLTADPGGSDEGVVLVSHIPMHLGLFTLDQMAALDEQLAPRSSSVYADFAGHVHVDSGQTLDELGYDVYTTQATHGDVVVVRLVHVASDGERFSYTHERVEVPFPAAR